MNSIELKKLMIKYKLKNKDVAEMLCVSVSTIMSWRVTNKSKKHRTMPDRMLKLLTLLLYDKYGT